MNKASYWLSSYCYDIFKVMTLCLFTIAFLYIYRLDVDFAWLLLILLPFALVPYTYVTSFLFTEEASAMNFTIYHNFLIAGLFPIVTNVLRIIKSTRDLGDLVIWIPRVIPLYCMTGGIVNISLKDSIATSRDEDVPGALDADVAGGDLAFLLIHAIFWSVFLVLIEIGYCNCLRKKGKNITDEPEILDGDVVNEQSRIEGTSKDQLAVKADHFRKVYGDKVAVKDVSFGLEFGDCFSLLGVNGAGKTTCFKMLTNDVVPTKGESHIKGFNVKSQFSEARKQIGYCPQFDAIFGLMTVREHLEFYAKIKKIPKSYVETLIKAQIKSMNLEQYENKQSGTLSGGNKRKLSVAMAMIGNPPVVFLDEPSAGMDPKARRFMWEIIAKISTRGKNSAVILTTHSMEEAEALSTNMGIMVDGQFKCFGSKQHIKNKFGTGYQVEIKFRTVKNDAIDEKLAALKILDFLRENHTSAYKVDDIKGKEVLMLNQKACIGILKHVLQNQVAVDEFNKEGFGMEIIQHLQEHGFYPAAGLIKWEYVLKNNWEALTLLGKL
jgi:ATP-binding cassette subfamily A (ABC1) protein 3